MIFTINYFEVVIVETREADCIFRSVLRGDGGMEVIYNHLNQYYLEVIFH